ncbi:type II toxin-antitoxin system RelE family toxin [Sulfurimonas sp. ST-27]|uniref:type II toxin-antitoxin system RelE family toxin n=1 Tax=unclassified Sulfurimonas TaxID=2623549 RepID=UPI003AB46284
MYQIEFTVTAKKDFKKVNKPDLKFIRDSLKDFSELFSKEYEIALMQKGKIKKLQGQKEDLYRLKLRSYRVIYKKYDDKLIILVIHVTTRESAYK